MHYRHKTKIEGLASSSEEVRINAAADLSLYIEKGNSGIDVTKSDLQFISNLIPGLAVAVQETKSPDVIDWILYFAAYSRNQLPHIFSKYLVKNSESEKNAARMRHHAMNLSAFAEHIPDFEARFCKLAFYAPCSSVRSYVIFSLDSAYKSGHLSENTYRQTVRAVAKGDEDPNCRFYAIRCVHHWGSKLSSEDLDILKKIIEVGLKSDVHIEKTSAHYAREFLEKAQ